MHGGLTHANWLYTDRVLKDIDSFDEQTIIAITDLGELTIRGWNLHITRLNLEQSEFMVDGEISSLTYTDVRPKAQGFFSKVLR